MTISKELLDFYRCAIQPHQKYLYGRHHRLYEW
jgi:hypothetical protein